MSWTHIPYILISAVLWLGLVFKAENKIASGLIAFWVLSFPILNRPEFLLHTPFGFDLQPTRIFLIGAAIYLSVSLIQKTAIKKQKLSDTAIRPFEVFLFLYIFISTTVLVVRSKGLQQLIPLASLQIVFGLMYLIARDHIPQHDYYFLKRVFIAFGVLSTLAAVIQFLVDPGFMRLSSERAAFGGLIRANGFMPDEYDHGLFLTYLSAWLLVSEKIRFKNILLVCFFGLGVFLTMHRGSWLAFGIVVLAIWAMNFRSFIKANIFIAYSGILLILILGLVVINMNFAGFLSQDFIYDQLFRETISVRMDLNSLGLKLMQKYPLGIGDYSFETYWQSYVENGYKYNLGRPLIVHNGFLGAGVKFGIPGGLCFIMTWAGMIYYALKTKKNWPIAMIPVLCCVAYLIINLTNEISYLGAAPQLLLAFLTGYFLK